MCIFWREAFRNLLTVRKFESQIITNVFVVQLLAGKISNYLLTVKKFEFQKTFNDKSLQIINYTIVNVFEVQLLAGKFQIIYLPLNNKAFLYKHSL